MTEKSLYWEYRGNGMDGFGVNDGPSTRVLPDPEAGQLLCRVDSVTLCASDVKMIRLGNDYPLFKGRDFDKNPAVCGHEVSLTVVKPGPDMGKKWPAGMRIGIQPDVYLNGERFCIGVNVPGGFAQYMILGKEVFISDQGSTAFPVPEDLSYAAVAQLEPIACTEASFRDWSRPDWRTDGVLLCWIGSQCGDGFKLDMPVVHKRMLLVDPGSRMPCISGAEQLIGAESYSSVPEALKAAPQIDDLLILGNPPEEELEAMIKALADDAIFCWLPDSEPPASVRMDIAQVHYGKIGWRGAPDKTLSTAMKIDRIRNHYKPGGKLLIMGGAGAMGRIHTLRALQDDDGPHTIVVTNLTWDRLELLQDSFGPIAKNKGKNLYTMATNEGDDWQKALREWTDGGGFDDIIVCAPGKIPAQEALPFLARDGRIAYFSGTSYGQIVDIPLGWVAWYGASVTASSGSNVSDQLKVLDKIRAGSLDPNLNVSAILGMAALKQGLLAVSEGRFAGKLVLYPQLSDLPMTSLENLGDISPELAAYVAANGWNRDAEKILYQAYAIQETL